MCVCVFDIPGQGSEMLRCNEIHGVLKGKVRSRCLPCRYPAQDVRTVREQQPNCFRLWDIAVCHKRRLFRYTVVMNKKTKMCCICRHIDDCEAVNIVKITIEFLPVQVGE